MFSLPFAAAGVFMAVLISRTLSSAHDMATWPEVPATIQAVESHSSGKSSRETKATYSYVIAGRNYTGHRVSLHSGSDNIGSFQTHVYDELQQHQSSGEPFRCYVNPQNPDDAILYRQPRWEMISFYGGFMLVFGGVGFGLLISALIGWRREKQSKAAQAVRPQEPWLWNPTWTGGVIRSNNRMMMWVALGFAFVWNAISMPAVFGAWHQYTTNHQPAIFIVMIFPVVGIGLAVWAARMVWLQIKYGTSLFRMSHMQGVIGGTLQGTVEIPVHIQPIDGFRISLRCVNRITTGSGKDSSTYESVLWEDVRLQAHEIPDGNPTHSLLPILFTVPRNCRQTDTENSDNQIVWRLEVAAATDHGPRYNSSFEVPMFITPDSVVDVHPDAVATNSYGHKLRPEDALRDCGVRVEALGTGGTSYIFPAARNKGTALFLTIFFMLWTGAIYAMFCFHAPLLFAIIFGLIDVGLFFGVLTCWFDWRRIEIAPDEVRVSGGIFGLAGLRRFPRGGIAAVEATSNSSQGDKQFFTLKIRTFSGATHTAGKGIVGRVAADVLAADLRRQLNLPEQPADDTNY